MNKFGLKFHHLGLATRDPLAAELFLAGQDYCLGCEVFDPLQKVNLKLATHSTQPWVELVYSAGVKGPVDDILSSQTGGVYHSCYTSDDPEHSVALLKESGLRVITVSKPKPAVLFGGKAVSFYMIKGIGLIEVIHDI